MYLLCVENKILRRNNKNISPKRVSYFTKWMFNYFWKNVFMKLRKTFTKGKTLHK